MMLMGGVPLQAAEAPAGTEPGVETHYKTTSMPVACGVIGCGLWGREILNNLAMETLKNAPVVAISDLYEPYMNRAKKDSAPNAQSFTDYRELLAQKNVEAVIVATPTHLHREIVEAALKAGKHVYCEAPLATSVEDSRAIAQAAKANPRLNFQAGLQQRSHPQNPWIFSEFVKPGDMGKIVLARSQWHRKESWRRASPDASREKALNWRLDKATSLGLIGEVGIHQLDLVTWYFRKRPAAVSGFGGILFYDDGRDVADTIQAVFEYGDGQNHLYDATLANSFDMDYDMIYGTDAAVMMRNGKAWMFKESDAPLLGWEGYARKDAFYEATGIAMSMDASKQTKVLNTGTEAVEKKELPLNHALRAFVWNCDLKRDIVKEFISTYGTDAEDALPTYFADKIAEAEKAKDVIKPAAGFKEGHEATVTAIKANEAVSKGQKIALQKEWYDV